ncbi:hypothetical protein FRC10_000747 [Ceratobasidium sp. 414]|nr:hypothetical protein FRC10_000747 [Ceratobasidium sp. 414]
MSTLSSSPLTEEAKKYSILRVCSGLDPQSSSPGQVVVDVLRDTLRTESAAALEAFEGSLANSLWLYNISKLTRKNLSTSIEQSAIDLCDRLLGPHSIMAPEKCSSYKLVQKVYLRETTAAVLKYGTGAGKTVFLSTHGNRQVPLGARVVARLCGPPLGFGVGLWKGLSKPGVHGLDKLTFSFRYACAEFQLGYSHMMTVLMAPSSELEYDFYSNVVDIVGIYNNDILNSVFDVFESNGSPSADNFPSKIVHVSARDKDIWGGLIYSVQAFLSDSLEKLVRAEAVSRGEVITLDENEPTTDQVNISVFQYYIREHIKVYATRVEQNHLGSSAAVCYDVDTAISKVWGSMPTGFGAKAHHEEENADHTQ